MSTSTIDAIDFEYVNFPQKHVIRFAPLQGSEFFNVRKCLIKNFQAILSSSYGNFHTGLRRSNGSLVIDIERKAKYTECPRRKDQCSGRL
jgi:hypothetical protein